MVIEMVSKGGPFEQRPAWVELAVQLVPFTILVAIIQAVFPMSPVGLASLCVWGVVASIVSIIYRRRGSGRVRRVSISDDIGEQVRIKIGDGTDPLAAREAVRMLTSQGFRRTDAEVVVGHFVNQVNPTVLKRMSPFFETREISEGSSSA